MSLMEGTSAIQIQASVLKYISLSHLLAYFIIEALQHNYELELCALTTNPVLLVLKAK